MQFQLISLHNHISSFYLIQTSIPKENSVVMHYLMFNDKWSFKIIDNSKKYFLIIISSSSIINNLNRSKVYIQIYTNVHVHAKNIYIHKTGVLIWYSTALLAINCVNNQLLNMYLAELSQYFFFDMKKSLSKKFLFFIFF